MADYVYNKCKCYVIMTVKNDMRKHFALILILALTVGKVPQADDTPIAKCTGDVFLTLALAPNVVANVVK